jgi:KTSC domain-containing protein
VRESRMKKNNRGMGDDLRPEYNVSRLKRAPRNRYPRLVASAANWVLLDQDLAFPDDSEVNSMIRMLLEKVDREPGHRKLRSKLPKMNPVKSSSILSIGYDDRSRQLFVQFVTGSVFCYREVEQAVFDAFLTSDSKGTFFNRNIKDRYAFERVV